MLLEITIQGLLILYIKTENKDSLLFPQADLFDVPDFLAARSSPKFSKRNFLLILPCSSHFEFSPETD